MKGYKGEVIHFFGGMHEFIGELDSTDHPNGPGWIRIKNPCLSFFREDPANKRAMHVLASLEGPQKAYRKFVDIYMPDDAIMEVRVLDKNGEMYKVYQGEINRIKLDRIIAPDAVSLQAVSKKMN